MLANANVVQIAETREPETVAPAPAGEATADRAVPTATEESPAPQNAGA
jgi:hypothetical protein